jgi:hypothetical protein
MADDEDLLTLIHKLEELRFKLAAEIERSKRLIAAAQRQEAKLARLSDARIRRILAELDTKQTN